MKAFIITGIDTGVGKTMVAAGLANYFQKKKINFDIQKWISTGDKKGLSRDLAFIYNSLALCDRDNLSKVKQKKSIEPYHNSYSFKFPASPHLAAKLARIKISINVIKESFQSLKQNTDYLIIEGVGGVMVPLTNKLLLLDLIKQLSLPVVCVTANTLGSINKTLLTIEVLKKQDIRILGLVYNDFFKERKIIQEDNKKIIYRFSRVKILGSISKIKTKRDLMADFQDIGKNLLKAL